MRAVAARFPAKMDRRIARVFVPGSLQLRAVRAVFAHEALKAGREWEEHPVGRGEFDAVQPS